MDLGIKNKVALVTGASSGLGFATALELAREGVKVAINSRSRENLNRAAQTIKENTGCESLVVEGDLTIENMAESIVEKVNNNWGKIDILISNAGGPPAGKFLTLSKDSWNNSANLTLFPSLNLTRAVISSMKKNKWGRIIFITSIAVKQPIDDLIISNTYRAGVTGFAKSISNEMAALGITVNTVCPGYTLTERLNNLARFKAETAGVNPQDIYSEWIKNIPAGRLGNPAELAALIAFLCSERAAYITGSSLAVDGGLYKGLL